MNKKEIRPDYFKCNDGPFSHGMRAGNFIFTTQVGDDADGNIVSPNVYEQTVQLIQNAERVLKEEGGSLNDVVKVTVFMLDMRNEFTNMNRAYREYMPNHPFPVRACVQVSNMVDGVKVEMEMIAHLPENN